MTNMIYSYEAKFTKSNHTNLAKVKVQGDKWCKHHCLDLHCSKMCYDDVDQSQYLLFQFRSSSDLTAFKIGFDVYDL